MFRNDEVNLLNMSDLDARAYIEVMLKKVNITSTFSLNDITSDDSEFRLLRFKKLLSLVDEIVKAELLRQGKFNELTEKTASVSL